MKEMNESILVIYKSTNLSARQQSNNARVAEIVKTLGLKPVRETDEERVYDIVDALLTLSQRIVSATEVAQEVVKLMTAEMRKPSLIIPA